LNILCVYYKIKSCALVGAPYKIWTVLCWFFLYAGRMGYNFNSFISFVTLENTELRLPEDDADASQNVGVLINIIDIYIYMCVCVCVCVCVCCVFVGMDNKIPIYSSCTLGSLRSEYLHPDYYYYYYYYYYCWNKAFS